MQKRKNEFCVNDRKCGSVWGNVVTADKLNELSNNTTIMFVRTLHEYNEKNYLFLKDMKSDDNYFVEV